MCSGIRGYWGGGRGGILEIFGGFVTPSSPNPDFIADRNMKFLIVFRLNR